MPFYIVRDYPRNLRCDALITAKEASALRALFGKRTGNAYVSKRQGEEWFCHEICAVQPVWKGGSNGEVELLKESYAQSLKLAARNGYESVAISLPTGKDTTFPENLRYDAVINVIREFLAECEMDVYLVTADFCGGDQKLLQDVRSFVKNTYMDLSDAATTVVLPPQMLYGALREEKREIGDLSDAATTILLPPQEVHVCREDALESSAAAYEGSLPLQRQEKDFLFTSEDFIPKADFPETRESTPAPPSFFGAISAGAAPMPTERSAEPFPAPMDILPDLTERIRKTDAGFSETLLRLIEQTGRKDSDIYNRANVSRQHFSKIRNNPGYRPTKATAVAFAIALELDMEQTQDLIRRAGYTLSESIVFDVVIMYFIQKRHYDLYDINEALFAFDQMLLGA